MKSTDSASGTQNTPFNYGYIIVAAAFIIVMMNVGMYLSMGVFFKPISEEMGWTRADTSLPISLSTLVTAFATIVGGNLSDRFGPRKIALIFVLATGAGYLLMSGMSSLWQFYLYFGLLSSTGASLMTPFLSLIPRWFKSRRTVMSGIIAAGGGVGGLVMPLVANWLITDFNWPKAFFIMGIAYLSVTLIAVFFLRRSPGSQPGAKSDSGKADRQSKQDAFLPADSGKSLTEAIQMRNFWLIALTCFAFGFAGNTINMHSAPNATDNGISSVAAAGLLSIMNGVSILGCVALGALGDKFGNRRMIILNFIIEGIAFIWLAKAHNLWMMNVFMIVYGIAFGSGLAQTAPLVARIFGMRSLGLILGIVTFAQTVGAALGIYLPGWIYDVNKNYFSAFVICSLLCGVAIMAMLLLKGGPAGKPDHPQV